MPADVPLLPKNFLRACLLLLLREQPAHGYELLERLRPFGFARDDPGGLYFHSLPRPIRLLDTRPNQQAGCERTNEPLAAGGTRTQFVEPTAGTLCTGVPSNARAIVGNATVVNQVPNAGSGFITLWPSDAVQPIVSNLNYVPGQVVPNAFTVGVGSDGKFNIYAFTSTHFIVDLNGYFTP